MNANSIALMRNKFELLFKKFDYDSFNKIISRRGYNEHGIPKASDILIEISKVSAFFQSKKIRNKLALSNVIMCAMSGWNFSQVLLDKELSDQEIYKTLHKIAKSLTKAFKKNDIKITIDETLWLIFCIAMIKTKFYSKFNYQMHGLDVEEDDGHLSVKVAFTARKDKHTLISRIKKLLTA